MIDFEQELYNRFGQVKDFTLGMRIAKYFYELGRSEKPNNHEGLDVTDFCQPIHPDIAKVLPDVINELTWGEDKKPVEGLDEVAEKWCKENGKGFVLRDKSAYYIGETLPAFKAGAEWNREQMMKEAVEGEVCGRVYDHINVRFADGICKFLEPKNISHIPADVSKYKVGDKVRVIIVKEDEK